jgi:hypothetical protein
MAGGKSNLPSWARNGGGGQPGNPNLPSWAHGHTNTTPAMSTKGLLPSARGKGHGGGLFGALKSGGHWLGSKAELAASDLKNIPGGLVQVAKVPAKEAEATYYLATGQTKKASRAVSSAHNQSKTLVKGTVSSTKATVEHPLRDPFQTGLLYTALLSGGATTAARAGEAAAAAREGASVGDIAKAAVRTPPVKPRFLSKNGEQTPLQASKNPAVRAAQAAHDRLVQNAIDNKPDSRLASYGTRRIGMSQDETGRYQARLRAVPAQALQRAAARLNGKLPGHVGSRVEQAALELTSVNTAPEDAARFHLAQAEKGVEPARNTAVAKLYQRVADRGLLAKNEHGDMIVNAHDHPKLAQADLALAKVQGRGDEILTRYGVMEKEALAQRVNAPASIRAGDHTTADANRGDHVGFHQAPGPESGAPMNDMTKMYPEDVYDRAHQVQYYGSGHGKALDKAAFEVVNKVRGNPNAEVTIYRAVPADVKDIQPGDWVTQSKGYAEIHAASEGEGDWRVIAKKVRAGDLYTEANSIHEWGWHPRNVRPGRGYVSYKMEEPKAPKNTVAGSTGPTVGEARSPIRKQTFTGASIQKGYVPKDVTGMAAHHYQQIVRFQNTSERRAAAIRSGSPVKQTSRDVLVRIPGASHEKINPVINEILGKSKITTDDLAGLHAALDEYRQELIPGLRDKFATDRHEGIGAPAPEGHVWVDRNILGDLAKPARGPGGKIARTFNNVNSAVTAATVYFKIGHVGTRVFTNAATNIIQGSATPLQIAKSVKLWHALSDEDKMRALAAAGQHGFQAMPHEGASLASKVAGTGAQFWAKHADAPFRFNSIAYEARKAGFDTPAKFKAMLDQAEDPAAHNLNAAQRAKVDGVLKRANREGIAYDRLSPFERNYISRATWFYPWLRGTANFLGNTILEHPYKAAIGGQAGAVGRQEQTKQLGDLPSYEKGLFKLGGSHDHPLVADFSTFSPFATPADVLDVAAGKAKGADFLNPAAAGLGSLAYKLNPYGQTTTSPIADSLRTAFGPAWPVQILEAYKRNETNQSRRMFHTTPKSALLRALVGPGMPRRINLHAAHSAAARERTGR